MGSNESVSLFFKIELATNNNCFYQRDRSDTKNQTECEKRMDEGGPPESDCIPGKQWK